LRRILSLTSTQKSISLISKHHNSNNQSQSRNPIFFISSKLTTSQLVFLYPLHIPLYSWLYVCLPFCLIKWMMDVITLLMARFSEVT
jgi:hypothetical protein